MGISTLVVETSLPPVIIFVSFVAHPCMVTPYFYFLSSTIFYLLVVDPNYHVAILGVYYARICERLVHFSDISVM